MPPKLYKGAEVCEMAQLQPYVLRSWEKEFPGIGLQKAGEGSRFYRQSDVDQVLRIKQLVFGEGLTIGGARRRLEASMPVGVGSDEGAELIEILGADARARIGHVRDGLRSLLQLLDGHPAEFALAPPPVSASSRRAVAQRGTPPSRSKPASGVPPEKPKRASV